MYAKEAFVFICKQDVTIVVCTHWERCSYFDFKLEAIPPTGYKAFNAWYTVELNRIPAGANDCFLRNAELRQRSDCMQRSLA